MGEAGRLRDEPGVKSKFAHGNFCGHEGLIDNWRLGRGPILNLRTGKRLAKRTTEIMIQFRCAPHIVFREREWNPTGVLNIQPDEESPVSFGRKRQERRMSIGM